MDKGGRSPRSLLSNGNCSQPCPASATFRERLRVSSCKMRGVDIFEIPTKFWLPTVLPAAPSRPFLRDPQAFSYRKRLVSASWEPCSPKLGHPGRPPEETWGINGRGMGWEAKAEEVPGSPGFPKPRLAREVGRQHNFEPVSWAPSAQPGMKWTGWPFRVPFPMGVR